MSILGLYRLKKDLPELEKGVIFEHREWDSRFPDRGNIGCGCMYLPWRDGKGQGSHSWSGGSYVMPGQLAKNREWFEPLDLNSEKKEILNQIEELKERVSRLNLM